MNWYISGRRLEDSDNASRRSLWLHSVRRTSIGESALLTLKRLLFHIQQQAGNSTQHWNTVVLLIDTVAAADAWILADRRGDSRRAAGFFDVQGNSAQLLWVLATKQWQLWGLSIAAIKVK